MYEACNMKTPDNEKLYSIYAYLMACADGLRNADVFACMLASVSVGQGAMPPRLGLSEAQFRRMMDVYFSSAGDYVLAADTAATDMTRCEEQDELYTLLMANKADDKVDVEWMAHIIIAGCMGADHLWQDLGLWSRQDLTNLMQVTFPSLAQRNDKNMKWKKFLYKQLCIQEGVYTCRAPSCEVCADYRECFADE